ncbi:glycosyltransferase [Limibacter armeniacum]|uniref:glycosyltransferase n=1 Tax=Limibacter armeniacum TaxID=466084 RepID=UPI002FE6B88A
MLEPIAIFFLVVYAFSLLFLRKGWRELPSLGFSRDKLSSTTQVTVLIPVRNEAANILNLLNDLTAQSVENFEVVVVDDHSDDETVRLVRQFEPGDHFNLRFITASKGVGKKSALTLGMSYASGELIVTTDGDCRVPEKWLETILRYYDTFQPQMICGGVTFHQEKNLWQKMLTVEFMSAIGTGAASLGLRKPNMCSGANLAFTKTVFEEVGGYQGTEQIPSGDDEFLMHKVAAKYPEQILYLKEKESIVKTQPPQSISALYHQRKRWASKWTFYENLSTKAVAVYVFSFHLIYILLAIGVFIGWIKPLIFITLFTIRVALEWFFLKDILCFFGHRNKQWLIPLTALWYSPYVVLIGLTGTWGSYDWKGRQLSKSLKPSEERID